MAPQENLASTLREGVLASFTSWLQTVDGKNCSPDQANQIGVDFSKYLYFCDQDVVRTQFGRKVLKAYFVFDEGVCG